MDHFPIFLRTAGRRIVLSGGGEAAEAKLRLLLKTEARVTVFADTASAAIETWADEGRILWVRRKMEPGDALCAALFYAADEDDAEDRRTSALARADGALVNIVDNLEDSQFITPAIVDRDPVTIAIGTEGAAPVLARAIKADLEARLSPVLGRLARAGKSFRKAAEALPFGRPRRDFWRDYYFAAGPKAPDAAGETLQRVLETTLQSHLEQNKRAGHVAFVGAGPGDPELLTLKARKALDEADVVIHDRLISQGILELCRREAIMIDAGKEGFGRSMGQEGINRLIVEHASDGAQVVRLKGGDATVFGRLDEEIDAIAQTGIGWHIVPGITSASAAVAALGESLTQRGRNSGVRLLTGHDTRGFADHDWRALAAPGEVAAIYMGKRAARFIEGRLLMHGAAPNTPVTIVENASRPDQRILATTLADLEPTLSEADLSGPALTLLGLAPRAAEALANAADFDAARLEAL
jgi:uroporphyrin-III C-methyltransferase/precorrin-2 dehydrogenase/sirohydrochlorin ferrochelatase